MSTATEFRQYRGDGTTRSGARAQIPGEEGVYLASAELADCVNTMLAVERPLLVTGEAGTGKTTLAHSIAAELEMGESWCSRSAATTRAGTCSMRSITCNASTMPK